MFTTCGRTISSLAVIKTHPTISLVTFLFLHSLHFFRISFSLSLDVGTDRSEACCAVPLELNLGARLIQTKLSR